MACTAQHQMGALAVNTQLGAPGATLGAHPAWNWHGFDRDTSWPANVECSSTAAGTRSPIPDIKCFWGRKDLSSGSKWAILLYTDSPFFSFWQTERPPLDWVLLNRTELTPEPQGVESRYGCVVQMREFATSGKPQGKSVTIIVSQ